MSKDEFNNIGSEDNPKIEEFKQFDAIEYYQPKETVKFYDDNATPPEDSASADQIENKDKQSDLNDIKDRFGNSSNTNANTNTSGGEANASGTSSSTAQSSPTVEGSNVAEAAEIEAAAAASSSAATVAATSASLTGGTLQKNENQPFSPLRKDLTCPLKSHKKSKSSS